MSPVLLHDALYFALTLVLSALFAMGGVGTAMALVPTFGMLGMALDLAKAIGLFVNSVSTLSASVMNAVRGVLDIVFALPLAISMMIATPLGAWMSRDVPQQVIQWVLAAFMVVSTVLLLFFKRQPKVAHDRVWMLVAPGARVGWVSGLIGGRIMTYRLSSGGVKKLIAVLLLILTAKMIWNLLR